MTVTFDLHVDGRCLWCVAHRRCGTFDHTNLGKKMECYFAVSQYCVVCISGETREYEGMLESKVRNRKRWHTLLVCTSYYGSAMIETRFFVKC